ncbi:RNA-binding domain-containing protein [Desarmillaria ectypa]|nr:RNA-binding domain-containing protein [Desarmillaria ectypa]
MDSLRTDGPSRSSLISPAPAPTNDDIEAVIQMATSARASPDGRTGPPRDTRTQLFVGNLPYRVRWQDLKDLFRQAGTVLRADVSLGPDNRSRGYGTVLLATAEDAGRAVDKFNGYSWQTRILEVRPDRLPPDFDNSAATSAFSYPLPDIDSLSLYGLERPASSAGGPRNLFVGNVHPTYYFLPFHCQWQDLKDLFRRAGTIIRADVALGQDGRSRGFGTVVFATDIDAERAVKMFNG